MPIDYSKWDNLEVSSSEDEDEHGSPSPRVTRLDAPSKVTFGGKQGSISAVPQGHATAKQPKSQLKSQPLEASKTTKPPPKSTSAIGDTSAPPSWTERGGLLASDGGDVEHKIKRKLYWAQDRYSVTLRLELRKEEKVGSVIVEGILPYSDRWSAVGSTKPRLVCRSSSADNVTLLEGELPHPVHLAEEDSDDGLIDWTVTAVAADEHRFLVITLHKAVPMQGLSVWWRRPLMEFPEADLDAVRGSGNSSGGSGASGTLSGGGAASKDFLEAWEEAHKIFREGKQKRAEGKPAI